jgi:hypothetical protein
VGKDSVQILKRGAEILEEAIRKEARDQGHFLTGAFESSLSIAIVDDGNKSAIQGEALYYHRYLENGFPAARASMKQFPFLVRYWQLRGLSITQAKRAAAATIRKWMKEGMPTANSGQYSKTGSRTDQVTTAYGKVEKRIDAVIMQAFDSGHRIAFGKTKNETI